MSTTLLSRVQLQRTWLAAEFHGGGFVSALASAWLKGDPDNRARIDAAFPHLIEKYGPESSYYPHEAEL